MALVDGSKLTTTTTIIKINEDAVKVTTEQ